MATCDLCNATTSWQEGKVYSASDFRELVARGLQPDESTLAVMMAFGASRGQAVQQWKTGLVAQSSTDWLLCPVCAVRASKFDTKRPKSTPAVSEGSRPASLTSVSLPNMSEPRDKSWWQFWK
ncbi:MAG: hypothetical protein PHX83_04185 [Acidobacteriia bacterium]|nr:hypothetical protein [Terriglobia bacterium]